jgi:phospholipid/cholesterol/gamma-HCH transport system substrate-binding protein
MGKRRIEEIAVGGFVVVAIVVILGFVFFLGGRDVLFRHQVKYKILFNSTTGLYQGDPVLLTGVEVGSVSRIAFPDEIAVQKILVEIAVSKDAASRIRKDTRAQVGSASLVYGKVVALTMGSSGQPVIPPDGFIETDDRGGISAIVDSTQKFLSDLHAIASKIDGGKGALSVLLNDPLEMHQTLHNLSASSAALSVLLDRIQRGRGPAGAIFADSVDFRKTILDFQTSAADLQTVARNLKTGRGAAGRLLSDGAYGDSLSANLASTVRCLASVAAKLDTGSGTLGRLLNDGELYQGLSDVVLGVKKNSVARWLINNRRKAGESERKKSDQDNPPRQSPGENR